MKTKRILIVDDSEGLLYILEKFFNKIGYKTTSADNGTDAIKLAITRNICLAIVDIGLPDMSGLKVIEKIKNSIPQLPIIAISKPKDLKDEISIYRKGVNLFHKKPISFKLLEAQVKNLVPKCRDKTIYIKDILIDIEKGIIKKDNSTISLTNAERKCLQYLIESNGYPCTRSNILKRLTINSHDKTEHSVDTLISRLRKKLKKTTNESLIETVNGIGYRISIPGEV